MKQIVSPKKVGPFLGVLLVAGLVIVLMLLNYLVIEVLAAYVGSMAALVSFWVLGGLIAWAMLRIFVVKYVYELGTDVLRLNRSYGKRERHIVDIYLSTLLYVGDAQEAQKRYPQSRRIRALHADKKEAATAVVFKSSSGVYTALLQANVELKAALCTRMKEK